MFGKFEFLPKTTGASFIFFTTKNVILQKVSRLNRMRKKSVGNNSMFNKKKVIEVKEL